MSTCRTSNEEIDMKRREFTRTLLGFAVGAGAGLAGVEALARVGRPLTPVSVAGVHRRTRRRTRRRVYTGVAIGATYYGLPYGCGPSMMVGPRYYCGGIYYNPVVQGGTTVYVVEQIDPGANTTVEIEEPY
jgi:hypothetical protein